MHTCSIQISQMSTLTSSNLISRVERQVIGFVQNTTLIRVKLQDGQVTKDIQGKKVREGI